MKEQINEYKMTEKESYEKFGNLSEEELNTKSNKNIYVKNDVVTRLLLLNAVDAKRKEA